MAWASEEMRGDRELCMAAVTQSHNAYQYFSEEMKHDVKLTVAFIGKAWPTYPAATGSIAWGWVPEDMKMNPEVRKAARV